MLTLKKTFIAGVAIILVSVVAATVSKAATTAPAEQSATLNEVAVQLKSAIQAMNDYPPGLALPGTEPTWQVVPLYGRVLVLPETDGRAYEKQRGKAYKLFPIPAR